MKIKNKIYYYSTDNELLTFTNTSALKNHLRQRLCIHKYININYKYTENRIAHTNKMQSDFISKPLFIYEYNIETKLETRYILKIEILSCKESIETNIILEKYE